MLTFATGKLSVSHRPVMTARLLLHLSSPKCSPGMRAEGILWPPASLRTVRGYCWSLLWILVCSCIYETSGLKPDPFLLTVLAFQPPQNETAGPGEGNCRPELQSRKENVKILQLYFGFSPVLPSGWCYHLKWISFFESFHFPYSSTEGDLIIGAFLPSHPHHTLSNQVRPQAWAS